MSLDRRLANWSKDAYKHATIVCEDTDTEVLMGSTGHMIVIAFRGTELDATDIKTDIQAWPVPWCGTFAHRGFKKALLSVWPQIRDKLSERIKIDRRIYLTGHSMGGALAVACAAKMVKEGIVPANLTTFGAPRVFFKGAQSALSNIPGKRHIFDTDPVPKVPFRGFLLRYRHDREAVVHGVGGIRHSINSYIDAMEK